MKTFKAGDIVEYKMHYYLVDWLSVLAYLRDIAFHFFVPEIDLIIAQLLDR